MPTSSVPQPGARAMSPLMSDRLTRFVILSLVVHFVPALPWGLLLSALLKRQGYEVTVRDAGGRMVEPV